MGVAKDQERWSLPYGNRQRAIPTPQRPGCVDLVENGGLKSGLDDDIRREGVLL